MYAVLNVTHNSIVSTVLSKERVVSTIKVLRNTYPDMQFKIVYLMIEGE